MKTVFCILFLLLNIASYSQKITIQGTAFDTTKGRNWVTIIRNDTIHKFSADTSNKWEDYNKLWNDTNYVVHAKIDGQFSIRVQKKDTLVFKSYRHTPRKIAVTDLLKQHPIKVLLEPEVCEIYVPCKDSVPKSYVFIGEKIKVDFAKEKYYCNVMFMDSKFNAEYKIIENIYGELPGDTVRFIAYDHYGLPGFSKYETVMLFVSNYCGELEHQKYQFYNVYKTTDNRWAAPYQWLDYSRLDSSSTLKPEIISFRDSIAIDVTGASQDFIDKRYPSPYYKIENGKAIPVYGNYVPELLELNKQVVLREKEIRARWLSKQKNPSSNP